MEHPHHAVMARAGPSRIVVESHRRWFGSARLGTFTISLDHAKAGKLPPTGRLDLPCSSGPHVLRARQWWYRSAPLRIDALEGASVFITADIAYRGHVLRGMTTFCFTPWRALSLTATPRPEG